MTTHTAVRPYRELLPNGEMKHYMHRGQMAVMQSKARQILALAGVQSGKTAVAVDWMEREIQERGPGDYLMVSATYPLMNLRLLPDFLEVFRHVEPAGKYRDTDKVFEFPDGKTRVIFGTATNPESLESATAKAAVCDEAGQRQFRREAHEAILRRLSIHQGRVLYPSTPYGLGWLKTEIYDRAKEEGSGIEVISWPSTANPVFPREEFERARRTMPPWKFRMFYEGKFDRPVGLVYDSFDEATCKIPRFPLPKSWPRYVGHDFGQANPAALFYAQDPATGYFYAYDEYLPGKGRSTFNHVAEFQRRTEGLNVIKRVGGNQTTEEEIREAYRTHGWPIQAPMLASVQAQIERVYALHKLNKVFVFNDLHNYLDELLSFSYVLDDKYEPVDKLDDEPSYHLLACSRYILSDFAPETARQGLITRPYRVGGSSSQELVTNVRRGS